MSDIKSDEEFVFKGTAAIMITSLGTLKTLHDVIDSIN